MTEEIFKKEDTKTKNPLLERINKIPGTTITLPSRGIFYTHGELDKECTDGEIVLFPMTAADELTLRSPDMLFQGTAIETVIKRCAPQIKKPMELLLGDVDYILTYMRKISYGKYIPIRYKCDCEGENSQEEEYMIPVDHFISNTKQLEISNFSETFKVTLSNGQVVVIRPLRLIDFIKMQQIEKKYEDSKELNDLLDAVAEAFSAVTLSVDGIEDQEMIKEWYKSLPRFETEKIQHKLDSIGHWGVEFSYSIKCKKCNQDKNLTTQLNPVYFFIAPSSPEMRS